MIFYHAVGELMLLLNTPQLQEQALCNWYRPTKCSIISTATHDEL